MAKDTPRQPSDRFEADSRSAIAHLFDHPSKPDDAKPERITFTPASLNPNNNNPVGKLGSELGGYTSGNGVANSGNGGAIAKDFCQISDR